jgi:4-hydroxybenzoyl-CoA thioesterase
MLVNRRTVRIEWGDCDPAGIVWYPRYFGIFDACTQHLFEAAGFPKPDMIARFDVVGYPMVDTRARFLAPSKFGDDIVVETRISQWKRSSFDIEHKVFRGAALAVEASETRVLVRRSADGGIKSCAVPEEIVAAFDMAAE